MRYTIAFTTTSVLAALSLPAGAQTVPRVMTDVPPVHSLVAQVMGETGTPDVLLGQGADPHSFQLRPSQAAALNEADLLFWIGPELTPWLSRALDGLGSGGESIRLLQAPGTFTMEYGEEHGDHAHDDNDDHGHDDHGHDDHGHDDHGHDDHGHDDHGHDDHGHDDHRHDDHGHDEHGHNDHGHDDHGHDDHGHDDHGHDDHAHGHDDHHGHSHDGIDPHAWLDPANARVWLDVIASELAEHDADNAETYRANAEAAKARIDALEEEVTEILAPVGDTPIYVFHDAYGYFAGHFGLNVAGTVALGDAASPGAARLTGLRDDLAQGGAVCIFPEAQHDPRQITLLAEGSDVRIGGELDPEGTSLTYGADLYDDLLRGMAQTIADCVAG